MGMSVQEYEAQKLTGRFRILSVSDAQALGVQYSDCYNDNYTSGLLVEFVGDSPPRIVGDDGGSPEDQCLTRDWAWVAVEMNALGAEVERLRRLTLDVKAPCHQCGDSLAKCAATMCCVGCNHATKTGDADDR